VLNFVWNRLIYIPTENAKRCNDVRLGELSDKFNVAETRVSRYYSLNCAAENYVIIKLYFCLASLSVLNYEKNKKKKRDEMNGSSAGEMTVQGRIERYAFAWAEK
jgi:hypothetical protein